ncbi:MAG: LTA synthase family protein [Oscillospiraceae bacterium]|nr:LTA synthase family protein [Oscillospiraceae bacterium]
MIKTANFEIIKLKERKPLITGLCISAAMLVLVLFNIKEFWANDVFNWAGAIKCLALFAIMTAFLIIKIKLPKWVEFGVSIAMLFAGPYLIFEMVRLLVGAPEYTSYIYEMNLIFYVALQFLVFIFTQSPRVAIVSGLVISWGVHIANELVLLIRGTPLVPTDLYAITTAMTVTTPQSWHFNVSMLLGTLCCVAMIAFVWQFKLVYPKWWARIPAVIVGIAITANCIYEIAILDYESFSTSTFDQESTNNVNGIALGFYINCRKMQFDEPVGYSEAAIEEFLSQYTDETLEEGEELPNIIVVMNESFADLSYVGKLRTDNPYMEYFNSLTRKYPHGKLLVSVLGGGTCNTEFEFLTSLSMLNMPNNCYAYMQHITGETPSLASYLNGFGYRSIAMHPFYEICWKRNSIYPFMGFEDYISGEDMSDDHGIYVSADRWEKGFGDDVEYIRTLISDSFFYKELIKEFESKGEDEKMFIFAVTVQNHSSYEYDGEDFETDVHITNYEGEYPRAEQYLSLVKDSNEALEELITYFEGVDEKTMIVFFGDHQPNVEHQLINQMAPYRNLIVNSYLSRYMTPFVIWANYDIGEAEDLGVMSANYLGLTALEYAGVPLSREYQMIMDTREVSIAQNAWGYYDKFHAWYDREDEAYKDEILNIYNYYTYWMLNDR